MKGTKSGNDGNGGVTDIRFNSVQFFLRVVVEFNGFLEIIVKSSFIITKNDRVYYSVNLHRYR